jgi:hypothetical protein
MLRSEYDNAIAPFSRQCVVPAACNRPYDVSVKHPYWRFDDSATHELTFTVSDIDGAFIIFLSSTYEFEDGYGVVLAEEDESWVGGMPNIAMPMIGTYPPVQTKHLMMSSREYLISVIFNVVTKSLYVYFDGRPIIAFSGFPGFQFENIRCFGFGLVSERGQTARVNILRYK